MGIFCKASFMPADTSCYQVHALDADAHIPIWGTARRATKGGICPPPEIIKTLHSDVDIFAETFKE